MKTPWAVFAAAVLGMGFPEPDFGGDFSPQRSRSRDYPSSSRYAPPPPKLRKLSKWEQQREALALRVERDRKRNKAAGKARLRNRSQ